MIALFAGSIRMPDINGKVVSYPFGECGTMSCLGVPGKGDGIYTSVPLSTPQIVNSQQGFLVVTLDRDSQWYLEQVRIQDGCTMFRGKRYEVK